MQIWDAVGGILKGVFKGITGADITAVCLDDRYVGIPRLHPTTSRGVATSAGWQGQLRSLRTHNRLRTAFLSWFSNRWWTSMAGVVRKPGWENLWSLDVFIFARVPSQHPPFALQRASNLTVLLKLERQILSQYPFRDQPVVNLRYLVALKSNQGTQIHSRQRQGRSGGLQLQEWGKDEGPRHSSRAHRRADILCS